MTLTAEQLLAWINDFMLPFFRFGAFFMAVPFFGATQIPVRVRIILALAVTYVLLPTLPPATGISFFTADGVLHILQQLLVGVAFGAIFHFVMSAITLAGHNIAATMGLSFAASNDPQNGAETTVLSQFYTILATLYFLGADAHLHLLHIIANTFEAIPLQQYVLTAPLFQAIVLFSSQIFVFGTLLVLPVLVGLLLVNLAIAVMTRAAPQLNLFSLGFPVTMLSGFALMLLSLPLLAPLLGGFLETTLEFMDSLAAGA